MLNRFCSKLGLKGLLNRGVVRKPCTWRKILMALFGPLQGLGLLKRLLRIKQPKQSMLKSLFLVKRSPMPLGLHPLRDLDLSHPRPLWPGTGYVLLLWLGFVNLTGNSNFTIDIQKICTSHLSWSGVSLAGILCRVVSMHSCHEEEGIHECPFRHRVC